jgi:hypothetical protein
MHVIGHDQVAPAEVRRSSSSAPAVRALAATAAFPSASQPAGGRPRSSGKGRGQHPVAALGEEAQSGRVVADEAVRIEVERAHVVDADVEAPEVPARLRPGALSAHGRQLPRDDVGRACPVDRHSGVGKAQAAGRPQRPGLQRDAPLELTAAVGDRVAEGEDAEAAAHGRAS